jgi:hypothetical protein
MVDRDVAGLAVRGYEITLTFYSIYVHTVGVTDSASISDPWGIPTYKIFDDSIKIAHAGTLPLSGEGPLFYVYFEADSSAPIGALSYLNIANAYLNEGDPIATSQNGSIRIIEACAGDGDDSAPTGFFLGQNRPNPFHLTTTLRFAIPQRGPVLLTVHDVSGRSIATLEDGWRTAGEFVRIWDGRDRGGQRVTPGIYFIRLEAGDLTATRKMVLLQ